jgi:hypothetical protein
VRVSAVNLVFGACLRCLFTGTAPTGRGFAEPWTPPAMLPPMPGNVDPAALSEQHRQVLMRFATELDGKPFIPALYRQIAHWPAVLAWLADTLQPLFNAAETDAARQAFQAAARSSAVGIVAQLPSVAGDTRPDRDTTQRLLAAIERYAVTSPEMTMFGRLILDALPSFPPSRAGGMLGTATRSTGHQ